MLRNGTAGRPGPVAQYALLAGPLLSMIDSSIVNVAAGPIARALHTSLGTVQWTVSGYLLACWAVKRLPPGVSAARSGEKYGRAGRAAPTKLELYYRAVEDGHIPSLR